MGEMASVTSLLRIAGEGRMDYHLFSLPLGTRGGNTMYKVITKEDTIRIPAEYMRRGHSLNQHIDRLAASAFEGRFDEMNRFILVTANHEPLGRGRIIHGDGAVYQEVRFDALLYCMDDYEVVEGAVSEVNEFGAFVRIGPMEALLHKSQIMEDHVDINVGMNMVEGRKTGKKIGVGDSVRARIVSLSPDTSDPRRSKIGLTCKQTGLGCHTWLEEER
ncbi:MAG TPA: DNA-directed RNA polymerase [Candidatus Poseidoniales archaeon]|nr:DNA-directed RNA polymerase [Euryarchaeota archaeon]DAC12653.1 MAG TPA: DNA-directed RNA polymerase [Candidatus Poseidoniales archaeon]